MSKDQDNKFEILADVQITEEQIREIFMTGEIIGDDKLAELLERYVANEIFLDELDMVSAGHDSNYEAFINYVKIRSTKG